MTLQKTIEKGVKKFVAQGQRCVYTGNSENAGLCAYENSEGQRCIVGHVLPKALLDSTKERYGSIMNVASEDPALDNWLHSFPELESYDYETFWGDFQELHDDATEGLTPGLFKLSLRSFLDKYGLSDKFVEKLDFSNWSIG